MEERRLLMGLGALGAFFLVGALCVLTMRWCAPASDPRASARADGCLSGGHDPGSPQRDLCLRRAERDCADVKQEELAACAEAIGKNLLRAPGDRESGP